MTIKEFIEGKLAEAERTLKAREQAAKDWAVGSSVSWRAAGCSMSKNERLEVSARESRIAEKVRSEVAMFKAVLEKIK